MRLAVWDIAPGSLLGERLQNAIQEYLVIIEASPSKCTSSLLEGDADLALIPTLDVIRLADKLDVIPGVGLSSIDSFEYARLYSDGDILAVRELDGDSAGNQISALAHIILGEQYGVDEIEDQGIGVEPAHGEGRLHWGRHAAKDDDLTQLDLGREWYELTSRPMVWGLLASRKDTVDPDLALNIYNAVVALEHQNPYEHIRWAFEIEDLQGLEIFSRYLFYHGYADEMTAIPFVALPETP